MKKNNIKPNIGIFDVSMIYHAYNLLQRGLLDPPFRFVFVMGGYMALQVIILSFYSILRSNLFKYTF